MKMPDRRSCINQYRASATLEQVRKVPLTAFVFAGDNGYHDTPCCGVPWNPDGCTTTEWLDEVVRWLTVAYRRFMYGARREDALRRDEDYAALWTMHVEPLQLAQPEMPILATWDDHDLGANDAGSEFPFIEQSTEAFRRFWRRPQVERRLHDPKRRTVYADYRFPGGIQLIMLDVRSFRSPLLRNYGWLTKAFSLARLAFTRSKQHNRRCAADLEYAASLHGTMLGQDQWDWLEQRLAEHATLRIIVSSIQLLRPHDGSETWSNFPRERERILSLLSPNQTTLVLSGDVHYGEVAKYGDNLYELTSSGLTEAWPCAHHNPYRIPNSLVSQNNFGLVEFDPDSRLIRLQLRDRTGQSSFSIRIRLVDTAAEGWASLSL